VLQLVNLNMEEQADKGKCHLLLFPLSFPLSFFSLRRLLYFYSSDGPTAHSESTLDEHPCLPLDGVPHISRYPPLVVAHFGASMIFLSRPFRLDIPFLLFTDALSWCIAERRHFNSIGSEPRYRSFFSEKTACQRWSIG
jgi:hypothetical protein